MPAFAPSPTPAFPAPMPAFAPPPAPYAAPAPAWMPTAPSLAAPPAPVATPPFPPPAAPAPAPGVALAPAAPVATPTNGKGSHGGGLTLEALQALMLNVVASRTGYPEDMLGLDMDLESDLGVDSIKRVEILSAVMEQAPGLPEVNTARMGAMRTLREIVTFLAQESGLGAPEGGQDGHSNGKPHTNGAGEAAARPLGAAPK